MAWVRAIVSEVFGLFVDDAAFAAAILAWLLVAALLLPRLDQVAWARGPILFAGLAVILLESAIRRARR